MKELKCPICGTEIVKYDTLDCDLGETSVTNYCVGECPHCKKELAWHEVYTFDHYEII
jgi:endogenous inhibitor of DNA gyrase (YacG/DUF329 family)